MVSRLLRSLVSWQLLYLLAVILFGAYVRATGSGAGCGSHWPLCNGQLIPQEPAIKTLIEFSHRLSSGLSLPFAILVFALIFRQGRSMQRQRFFAFMTMVFLLLEGLLGAGLVYFEHVAENTSVYRAFSMGLHLINTFTLMAFATLTWLSVVDRRGVSLWQKPPSTQHRWLVVSSLLAIVLVGVSGAITALGDTVFPLAAGQGAWSLSQSPSQHLFIKLRVYHPLIAVAVAAYLTTVARKLAGYEKHLRPVALGITYLLLIQLALGYLNVQLLAPIWLQLLHLGIAELIWMGFIVLTGLTFWPYARRT